MFLFFLLNKSGFNGIYRKNPKGQFKKLNIISINGPEGSISNLINLSRELQTKLNKLDLKVISFELKNKDQLIIDDFIF